VALWDRFRGKRGADVDHEPLVVTARLGKRRNIRDADFLTLEGEDLVEEDFSGRKLEGLSVSDSRLSRCRLERMDVESASFGDGLMMSEYTECSFDGSRFEGTSWGRARFVRCSFRDVRLKGLFGFDTEFVDCVFTGRGEGIVFNGSPITGLENVQALADKIADLLDPAEREALQARIDDAPADRSVNEFRGNDFSGMDLVDVGFRRGIDLTDQRFPAEDGYVIVADARAAAVRAREQVRFWDDDADREFALAILRDLMRDVEEGQEQLFLRADEWREDEAHRALFGLLTSIPG
jgi:uncharacterized protein YjbI with pentapeptide repeats